MSEKKTALPSLRNQDSKIVKTETEKINKLFTHISTNNMELNELICAGVKLVYTRIGVPWKNTDKNSRPGWEIRLERDEKSTTEENRVRKTKTLDFAGTRKEKQHKTIYLEEIDQKVLVKDFLKSWEKIKQYIQFRTFQNYEKCSTGK